MTPPPLDPVLVEARDRGVSPEEIVALMRRRGLSIVQACAAFTKLYGVGLGQAKVAVTSHPAYRDVAQAAEPLHDDIVNYFQFAGSHAGDIREDSPLKLKLVWIPPGDFTMGSPPDDKDRCSDEHQVQATLTLGFWFGQYAVTRAEWQSVMQTAPWGTLRSGPGSSEDPATSVAWEDAAKFCEKLTEEEHHAGRLPAGWRYALPTEPQWEYACRAGTKSRFSFGDDAADLGDYAWYEENTREDPQPHAVGRKQPNPWGLYDMHGNVWEWCRDWYDDERCDATDPEGPSDGDVRVYRGGGCTSPAANCRSAARECEPSGFRMSTLGFRVAVVPSFP